MKFTKIVNGGHLHLDGEIIREHRPGFIGQNLKFGSGKSR